MFDAHVHLDFLGRGSDGAARREALDRYLSNARLRGVNGFALPGVEPIGWASGAELARSIGAAFGVGVHPAYAGADPSEDERLLRMAAERLQPHFIGETGLDKREEFRVGRAGQERLFSAHLELAAERAIPLVLHVVGRHGRVLEMLRTTQGAESANARGMVHGFVGSMEVAEEYASLGFLLGIGERSLGSGRTARVVAEVPLEWLLTESDEPTERSAVPGVVQRIAELRGEDPIRVAESSELSARRLLRIASSSP